MTEVPTAKGGEVVNVPINVSMTGKQIIVLPQNTLISGKSYYFSMPDAIDANNNFVDSRGVDLTFFVS